MVCYDRTIFGRDTSNLFEYLESEDAKHLNIEKIAFKVVKLFLPKKFLPMHITNQKLSFYIFTVRN